MTLKNSAVLIALLLLNTSIFSQQDKAPKIGFTDDSKSFTVKDDKKQTADYKIVASNQNYIEIEFTPQYTGKDFDFKYAQAEGKKYGEPDLRFRAFPLYLTSQINNKVEIVDSRYELINNAEVKPVATPKKIIKNKEEVIISDYIKNDKVYSLNKFLPSDAPAKLGSAGAIRNRYFANLIVNPVEYNPVSRTVKKYSYIKIRVTFGSFPVLLNKQLSNEEKDFLKGVALNWKEAENWSTNEFNRIKDNAVTNSIFASGDFYKMEIKESGIYKLDKNFLQNAGINVSAVNPKTIKIYGNDGIELPYSNCAEPPNDPMENAIYVEGENDGVFNDNDYVLFYGQGPIEWQYDTVSSTYFHYQNPYSRANYYWITYGGGNGLRMQNVISPNVTNPAAPSYFIDRTFENPEINNLGATGLLWVSQRIGVNESFTFNKELKGYIDGTEINLRLRIGNGSTVDDYFNIADANSGFQTIKYIYPVSGLNSFAKINLDYLGDSRFGVRYALSAGRNTASIKVSLPSSLGNTSQSAGYYDFYEILYKRSFSSADGNVLRFNALDTTATVEYKPSGFTTSDVKIFDVTDYSAPKIVTPISYSGGQVRFQATQLKNQPNEFYVIGGQNYKTPSSVTRTANQNLKGSLSAGADMIVFYHKDFVNAVSRYKNYRENSGFNSLKIALVDVEQLYNEFSGGKLDPVAMRNFMKYAYNNFTLRPTLAFFFGDGSYDYKNIYNLSTKNYLPPIEVSSDASDEIASFCSDDFAMEINECFPYPVPAKPDFGTGRVCASSNDEANIYVDKLIAYEDPANFDRWRDKIMYVADDGWTTDNTLGQEGSLHTGQCEDVAENHTPKFFEKEKVYIVAYPAVYTPQGRRKPDVNPVIVNGWNEGRLVINYTGHGSTDLWAHEHIFERQVSIPLLNNKNRYTFLTIASCDLARWDDPYGISAAEQLINESNKGAIGVVAAVRPVYAAPNATFNNLFWDNFTFLKDTLNLPIRIGKAMFNTKQNLFQDNDLKFSLICDPSLRIGIPQYFTKIDSLNGPLGLDTAKLKALQKIRIAGSVLRPDSTFWGDYNGTINLKVLDVDKQIHIEDFGYPFDFRLDGGTIFTGRANVVNGKWSVEFIVPKDISYSTGNGKILAYFKNSSSDGVGYTNQFTINGIDSTAVPDTTGPTVNIYLDSRNFRNGDLVNQSPKIIADFYDQFGMNLTGTIGHKIEATLNNNEQNKIDLTPYFNTTGGYQNGTVEYQLQNLPAGKNTLSIKAYDTYNNYAIKTIEFNVQSSSNLTLENVYNYPNPMKSATSFVFNHNFDKPLNATIKIYTVSGRLIKELNKTGITDKFVMLDWDGRDSDGDAIANGTYIYKLTIKSEDGTISQSNVNKLAKLQ
ncbi:MAG: type IX secretion system sortase PorU [Ignavibacteria bacterium]|nr:type IX secretion system sortase PorU [Ignavibacteria bacterium]